MRPAAPAIQCVQPTQDLMGGAACVDTEAGMPTDMTAVWRWCGGAAGV
jgi:hypothetical protein